MAYDGTNSFYCLNQSYRKEFKSSLTFEKLHLSEMKEVILSAKNMIHSEIGETQKLFKKIIKKP